jgi:Tfp pilus assembly PilM family ATPase
MLGEGKNLVGVDIGASAIKVVQLKEPRKKLQVVRYGFAPLPPQAIIDGHVMNSSAVVESRPPESKTTARDTRRAYPLHETLMRTQSTN